MARRERAVGTAITLTLERRRRLQVGAHRRRLPGCADFRRPRRNVPRVSVQRVALARRHRITDSRMTATTWLTSDSFASPGLPRFFALEPCRRAVRSAIDEQATPVLLHCVKAADRARRGRDRQRHDRGSAARAAGSGRIRNRKDRGAAACSTAWPRVATSRRHQRREARFACSRCKTQLL